jgi:hypothetical protein
MSRRLVKRIAVGSNCSVVIYRNAEYGEFQIQQKVGKRVIGGKEDGGAFETDKRAAEGTAAAMVKELQAKHAACGSSTSSALRGPSTANKFKGHAIIRQIVGRVHVGDSDDSVVEYAKSRLAEGAWASMSTVDQRAFVREVKRVHAANRKTYQQVMTGRR